MGNLAHMQTYMYQSRLKTFLNLAELSLKHNKKYTWAGLFKARLS